MAIHRTTSSSRTRTKAILVQDRQEVYRSPVDDVKALEKLLDLFFGYERAEITEFRKAVEQFKTDLPIVLEALRSMIERAHKREPEFRKAAKIFSSTPRRRSTQALPRPTCARC